jgi:phospholipid/cholesterol/gamma-HCH transport system substrate-binding protein
MTVLDRLRGRRTVMIAAGLVLVLIVAWVGEWTYHRLTTMRITAYFESTTGLYPGDDVRVLGVPVGHIDSITPGPDSATVRMTVRSAQPIPADARAVIIAPTLVSGRFVQLAPVYAGGPKMSEGGSIPLQHTAVPVEWDEVKAELTKLATALGPDPGKPGGSLGEFLNTAAANLGNGTAASMHQALRELSQTMSVLSDGRTDLFGTVRNLQQLTQALSDSNTQIVAFGGRLASVTQVLSDTSSELGSSLDQLDTAMGQVNDFVSQNTGTLTQSMSQLSEATRIFAEKRQDLAKVLHIAPTSLANFYNIYDAQQGALAGQAMFVNMSNPVSFICGSVAAMAVNDSDRSARLCAQYLGPMLDTLAISYPPFASQPVVGATAQPDQLRYSPPSLRSQAVPRNLGALMAPTTGGGR